MFLDERIFSITIPINVIVAAGRNLFLEPPILIGNILVTHQVVSKGKMSDQFGITDSIGV